MNIREAINRGNNLFVCGLLGVVGLTFAESALGEPGWAHRADDIIVALIAVAAIVWFFQGGNRYLRSWVPLALMSGAFLAKLAGAVAEFGDASAIDDDFAGILIFAAGTIIALLLYYLPRPLHDDGPGAGA